MTANHKFDEKGRRGVPIGFNKPGFGVMQVIPVRDIGFDKDRNKLS